MNNTIFSFLFSLITLFLPYHLQASTSRCEELIDENFLFKIIQPIATVFKPEFEIKTVRFLEDSLFQKELEKGTKEYGQAMQRLLLLFSNTINENSSNKLSIEKGEMHFGYVLPNGTSVEFKYEVDRRYDKSHFILTKIEFRKRNMGEVEISDDPLNEKLTGLKVNGLILAKTVGDSDSDLNLITKKKANTFLAINEKDINPDELESDGEALTLNDLNQLTLNSQFTNLSSQLPSIDIYIPFVIKGEILDHFVSFAEVLQDLDRSTVRKYAQTGQLGRLKAKGYQSYLLGNAEKVFFKQAMKQIAFKGPIFAALYFFYQLHDIKKDLAELGEPDIDSVMVSQESSEFLNHFFDKLDQSENWHNTKIYSQLKKEIKINLNTTMNTISKSTDRVVNYHLKKEKYKADITYYHSDTDFTKIKKISTTELLEKDDQNTQMDHIVIHFPEQETLILITRSYGKNNPSRMIFQSHVVVRASKAPLLYEGLIELMTPTQALLNKTTQSDPSINLPPPEIPSSQGLEIKP
jgi:hypothetical protein